MGVITWWRELMIVCYVRLIKSSNQVIEHAWPIKTAVLYMVSVMKFDFSPIYCHINNNSIYIDGTIYLFIYLLKHIHTG